MDALKDLELLVQSRYPVIALETWEEERAEDALRRVAESLDIPLFVWTVSDGLRRSGLDTTVYETQQPIKALEHLAAVKDEGIYLFKDLHGYLDQPEVVRRIRDLSRPFARRRRALVLCAPRLSLPEEIQRIAGYFRIELPGPDELRDMVRQVVEEISRQRKIKVKVTREEFARLLRAMAGMTLQEAERALTSAILEDGALTGADLDRILDAKRQRLQREGILDFLLAEEAMADVGGLKSLKDWLRKRQGAFSARAKSFGVTPPKGVLLLGVQGCGKSLAAKAVAREWGMPLLRLEPGRLYDKWIGESEKNLERALETAERMAPCVLMMDEIEKGFASAGSSETDAGLSRRIFGRLLSWLQERKAPVFVVATCNAIHDLPPELMRKGRFDEMFFVDLPDAAERREIFALHLRRRSRDPVPFDLDRLASESEGFSGAEIEQSVVSALYTAFSAGSDITTETIVAELNGTHPLSVSRSEEVLALRQWASGRAVMAG